jgi:hypothetical protein
MTGTSGRSDGPITRARSALVQIAPISLVLAILLWLMFYYRFPDVPPTATETTLIVVFSTVIATCVLALYKRFAHKTVRKGR